VASTKAKEAKAVSILSVPAPGVLEDFHLPALPPSKAKRPRLKPERHVRMVQPVGPGKAGHVVITVGNHSVAYQIERYESPMGDAFRLTKLGVVPDGEEGGYDCLLADDGSTICSCTGHLAHGYCKHVDGLATLKGLGLL
jgi:hypothetical protein